MNKGVNKFLVIVFFFIVALIFISSTFSNDTYSHTLPVCCDGYETYDEIENGNVCVKILKNSYESSNLSNGTNIACYTYAKNVCCQRQEKNSETDEFFTIYRGDIGTSCNSSEVETDLSKCGDYACYTYESQPENCTITEKPQESTDSSSLENTGLSASDTSSKEETVNKHPVPRTTDNFADGVDDYLTTLPDDTLITIPYNTKNTLKDDGTLISHNISGCKVNIFAKTVIGINVTNKIGQHVLTKNMVARDDVSFKAGTSVGLSVYEQHAVSWTTENSAVCKKSEVTKSIIDKVKKEYGSFLSKSKSNYQLVLSDSNDINSLDETIIQNNDGYCADTPDGISLIACSYEMRPSKICIDYKTGNVKYDVTDCSDDFIEYPSDQLYWQYFIPLNATGDFSFVIEKIDADKYSQQECKDIIRTNYSNYYNFVSYDNINYVSHALNTAISQVNGGCYIKPKIDIPTNQYFYYLNDDNTKISGLNFYFRKINPSDPFPRPVTNLNSLWYDWYMDHYDTDGRYDKSEKIFNNEAYVINIDDSKKENIDNVSYDYVSWEDIELSGRSKFVLDLFEKTPDLNLASGVNKYSKLGCGIINSLEYLDDEKLIVNPYYLERCAG